MPFGILRAEISLWIYNERHVLKIILPDCCVENKIANFVVILQIWM